MTASIDHLKHQSQRAWFAQQFCMSAQLPFVMMGLFDSRTRCFAESWFGNNDDEPGPTRHDTMRQDMARMVEARLAVHVALHMTGAEVPQGSMTATHGTRTATLLVTDGWLIGMSAPVGQRCAIVAFAPPRGLDPRAGRSLINVGLAYVSQELTKSSTPQTQLPAGTVEAAMQVLSVDFLVVTAQGKICYDSRRVNGATHAGSGGLFGNGRLTLSSDKERADLEEAIRGATSGDRRTAMISVMANAGVARMVVVTPLVNSNPPTALLLFDGQQTDHVTLREYFFNIYGLTRAEREIAHALLSGQSVTEAAESQGLTAATVRSYMKQVFAKTGIHRQSELISLYHASVLPVAGAKVGQQGVRHQ